MFASDADAHVGAAPYHSPMTTPGDRDLKPNDVTTRAALGARYGGNQQAGIAHSAVSPNIMVYSDADATESPGYAYDGWAGDVYQYTGEGKRGDQTMSAGNKALLDHSKDGRALRMFVADGTVSGGKPNGSVTSASLLPMAMKKSPLVARWRSPVLAS